MASEEQNNVRFLLDAFFFTFPLFTFHETVLKRAFPASALTVLDRSSRSGPLASNRPLRPNVEWLHLKSPGDTTLLASSHTKREGSALANLGTFGCTPTLPTLTSLALMDLTKGPVCLEVPEWLHSGYYVIGLHSPWNDCPVTLGSRTNKNENNVYVFVGPGFHSCIQTLTPQSMAMTGESWNPVTIVRVPSNQYLLYARILAKSKHYSLSQVRELQHDFNIVELDKHPVARNWVRINWRSESLHVFDRPEEERTVPAALKYWEVVLRVMATNPPYESTSSIVSRLESLGIFDSSDGFLYPKLLRLGKGSGRDSEATQQANLTLRELEVASNLGWHLMDKRVAALFGNVESQPGESAFFTNTNLGRVTSQELDDYFSRDVSFHSLPACAAVSRNRWLRNRSQNVASTDPAPFAFGRRDPFSHIGAYHPSKPSPDVIDLSTTTLLDRAISSHAIPFRLPVPECAEYYCLRTVAGAPLRGGRFYVMVFESSMSDISGHRAYAEDDSSKSVYKRAKEPTTDLFWSVMTCGRDFAPVPFTQFSGKTVGNLTPARKRDIRGNFFILFGSEPPQDSALLSNFLMIPTSLEAAWYAVLQFFIPDPYLLLNDDAKRYDPPPIVEIASKEEWELSAKRPRSVILASDLSADHLNSGTNSKF